MEMILDRNNKFCIDEKIVSGIFKDDEFFNHVKSYKKLSTSRFPKTDQWCDDKFFNLAFALAGFSPEDIEVSLIGRRLFVSHSKADQEDLRTSGFIHRGIAKRSFRKGYYMDNSLDLEKLSVSMKDGLLTVKVPLMCESDLVIKKMEILNG